MTHAGSMASLSALAPAVGLWRGLRQSLSLRNSLVSGMHGRMWQTQQAQARSPRAPSSPRWRRALSSSAATAAVASSAAEPVSAAAAVAAPEPAHELQLFNTLTRQKEAFRPRPDQGNRVSMYVCGVTVYDYSHIGHARVYVAFDVLYRYLRHLGYDVTYVRNFTDIDDKIIARGAENGEDPLALSRRFITEFHADMELLGCLPPTLEPKATEYIDQMIDMIQHIIENGHAYAVDGDVFFDVASLPGYGRLSGRSQEDNRAGERVAVDSRKRGAADFALWKSAKPGEPTWDSPWGPGRPGWHIECSAMIKSLLGPVIDIHGGGRDLVFPHHENELAQSRAAESACSCGHDHGAQPASASNSAGSQEHHEQFVRYWVHNGFVNVDSEKMSKSLGNFFTIREVVGLYHPAALRWFLVGTQYRQPINYTQRALEEASDRLYYLYQTLADADAALAAASASSEDGAAAASAGSKSSSSKSGSSKGSGNGARGGGGADSTSAPGEELLEEVLAALADDLNTPLAVAALSTPLKHMNDLLHTKKGKKQEGRLEALASYRSGLEGTLRLLGLWSERPEVLLAELRALALVRAGLSEEQVAAAIQERADARAAKDYAAADAVRLRMEAAGVLFMDTPTGTVWKPGPRLHVAEETNAAAGRAKEQEVAATPTAI